MSGECERCGHHCMDCACADKAPDLSPKTIEALAKSHDCRDNSKTHPVCQLHRKTADTLRDLAARVDALTKEVASYHDAYEGEKQGRAVEVEALTKERDVAVDMLRECRAQRDAALAASGAVAEAMRESAIAAARRYLYRKDDSIERAIRALPLDPDAAAALERHDEAIWLRVREVLTGTDWTDDDQDGDELCDAVKAAILARRQKEDAND